MYEVDQLDNVIELETVPQPDAGAPLPFVMSDDINTVLAYIVSERDPHWDGSYINVVSRQSSDRPIAVVHFESPLVHMFGAPNDEAFSGHPLADRGLRHYSVHEVEQSSWIRKIEKLNFVHPNHSQSMYSSYRHFIFAFHDSTFECIAHGFQCKLVRGSMQDVLAEMMAHFE